MPRQNTGEVVVGVWACLTKASGFAYTVFVQEAWILVVASTIVARKASINIAALDLVTLDTTLSCRSMVTTLDSMLCCLLHPS